MIDPVVIERTDNAARSGRHKVSLSPGRHPNQFFHIEFFGFVVVLSHVIAA
jgi:hypothetical protein